jgi:hypothetical protein
MVSELEARARKHAFMQPNHPLRWGRAIGPLMSYAAFFLLAALGGLTAHKNPNSTASMNTIATPNAITAQRDVTSMSAPPLTILRAGTWDGHPHEYREILLDP